MEASSLVEREQKQDSTYSNEQEKDPTQLTLAQSIDRSRHYPPNSLQAQEINKVVSHFFPISTVDEAGFRCLVYKLNPSYNCPSRKHFSKKELPQLYTNVGDTKIKPELDRISDFWTSSLHNPYLRV